ncbi:hypothetical protein AAFF_G00415640 [Aldrovandia affinis]|uniref:Uncharacterized protein n=1 Tax=Aldrovandia affinis TaxID=143900 RepID=A0AAD7SAY3_9TELE|nr:hypothetical protein AAFF_G00415640 [Aldrovandia affinis]
MDAHFHESTSRVSRAACLRFGKLLFTVGVAACGRTHASDLTHMRWHAAQVGMESVCAREVSSTVVLQQGLVVSVTALKSAADQRGDKAQTGPP